jgi:hypothetical protein
MKNSLILQKRDTNLSPKMREQLHNQEIQMYLANKLAPSAKAVKQATDLNESLICRTLVANERGVETVNR